MQRGPLMLIEKEIQEQYDILDAKMKETHPDWAKEKGLKKKLWKTAKIAAKNARIIKENGGDPYAAVKKKNKHAIPINA